MNQVVGLFWHRSYSMVKDSWHSLVYIVFPVFVEMDRCKHDVLSVRTAADTADLYESASIDGAT